MGYLALPLHCLQVSALHTSCELRRNLKTMCRKCQIFHAYYYDGVVGVVEGVIAGVDVGVL